MKEIEKESIPSIKLFLFGCITLVGVAIFDKLYLGINLIDEGWPKFSAYYIFRIIIVSISVSSILWSFSGDYSPEIKFNENNKLPLERLSILGVMYVSALFLLLFVFSPLNFNIISLEDGFVEWGSAILFFGSCIVAIISVLASRGSSNIPKVTRFSLIILSLIFFVIAMEEISWFQRVLEVEVPKVFDGTYQKEINLHNFATNTFENIYYFGVFVFLVVFPYIRLIFSAVSKNNYCNIIAPRPFICVLASIIFAYNFDMWNILFTQIAFFGSIVILFHFFLFSSDRSDKYLILFAIFLVIATQSIFLSRGSMNFTRLHEVTEYKEFFIPLAFFIYSVDMFVSIKKLRQPEKG